jgi:hypothetical protein
MDQEWIAEIARQSGPEAAKEAMRQFGWTVPSPQTTDEARINELLAANPELAQIVDRFAQRLANSESEGNAMQTPATQQTTEQPTPQQTGRIRFPVLRTSTDNFRPFTEEESEEQAWLDDGCPVIRHYDYQRGWVDVPVTYGDTTADCLAGIRSELLELKNGVHSIVERPASAAEPSLVLIPAPVPDVDGMVPFSLAVKYFHANGICPQGTLRDWRSRGKYGHRDFTVKCKLVKRANNRLYVDFALLAEFVRGNVK